MWQLRNLTPFGVERAFTRDREGAEVWQVAACCSFHVDAAGRVDIAEPCDVPLLAPEYAECAGGHLLVRDTDFALARTRTDVLVEGDAIAPGGRPCTAMDVAVAVGGVEKRLRIVGDRVADARGESPPPAPFDRMPITFARALGGPDPAAAPGREHPATAANPVGCGLAAASRELAGRPLPNVAYVSAAEAARAEGAPAGLGPIAPHWSSRRRWAGTYDETWRRLRAPLVPTDLDDRFFQAAPPDQWTATPLVGGEPVRVIGMTEEGRWSFVLPRVVLSATVHFTRRRTTVLRFAMSSVRIDTRSRRIHLGFLASHTCHADVLELVDTVVRFKPVRRLWPAPVRVPA
ncbi:MAG: DUF2169 domain-containing protein [Gemmatimonadaceae bacterium]|jgi:hypothetical protein|nr:DUF2169 domain-containing protein [Gemmatimonadaceae bacterium]